MRLGVGFAILGLLVLVVGAPGPAAPPPDREVVDAFQKQLKEVTETVGPSVVCVVVSRSEHYPKPEKPPGPGQLGGFDRKAFLNDEPSPLRERLAPRLDLSDPAAIPDNA